MKFKSLLILIAFLGISSTSFSQDYLNGIGLRGGIGTGITFKHFISTTDALEGILVSRYNTGFHLTGLYEMHRPFPDVDRLNWFFGGGAHIGAINSTSDIFMGIDFIAGIEYVFNEIPFNIGLDFKPMFNLIGDTRFWADELALSFRFYF